MCNIRPPPDGGVGHDYDVNIFMGDNMGSEKWALFCDIGSETWMKEWKNNSVFQF